MPDGTGYAFSRFLLSCSSSGIVLAKLMLGVRPCPLLGRAFFLIGIGRMIIGSGPHTSLSADPGGGEAVTNGPSPLLGLPSSLLTAIVESSDDAIASKTLDGIVTSWNHAAERLFGYAAQEMIGRPISILAAPGRESEMAAILERIRQGERVEHFDTIRRRRTAPWSRSRSPSRRFATRPAGSSAPRRSCATSASDAGRSGNGSCASASSSTG